MELKETEKRLLEAVSHIVENDGFTKIGVNRIANQAGCDKVLIYRYFGGLDGLLGNGQSVMTIIRLPIRSLLIPSNEPKTVT